MLTPPAGLQLDLLSIIVRLEQIRDECVDDDDELTAFGEYLLFGRVLTCDLPRLRDYLTPETLEWQKTVDIGHSGA